MWDVYKADGTSMQNMITKLSQVIEARRGTNLSAQYAPPMYWEKSGVKHKTIFIVLRCWGEVRKPSRGQRLSKMTLRGAGAKYP